MPHWKCLSETMPSEEELDREIRRLTAERNKLRSINQKKLTALRLRWGNVPEQFRAEHPVLSYIGKGLLESAKTAGQVGKEVAKDIGQGAYTVGKALYENNLRAQKEMQKKKKQAKELRKLGCLVIEDVN